MFMREPCMRGQATCMQEVVDPLGLPGDASAAVAPVLIMIVGLRLRKLVLMVRKRQISAAGVDVHGLPQHLTGHGRALYMPACTVHTAEGQGPAAHYRHISDTCMLCPSATLRSNIMLPAERESHA